MAKQEGNEGLGALVGGLIGAGLGSLLGHAAGKSAGYQEGYRAGYASGKEEATKSFRANLDALQRAGVIRKDSAGKVSLNLRTTQAPKMVLAALEEAAACHMFGLPKSSCVMAGVAAEAALKAKWKLMKRSAADPDLGFHELLEWAHREGVLTREDHQMAQSVRTIQNVYKHQEKALVDTDPLTLLLGTLRLVDGLF